jgi:hypothetical protein
VPLRDLLHQIIDAFGIVDVALRWLVVIRQQNLLPPIEVATNDDLQRRRVISSVVCNADIVFSNFFVVC